MLFTHFMTQQPNPSQTQPSAKALAEQINTQRLIYTELLAANEAQPDAKLAAAALSYAKLMLEACSLSMQSTEQRFWVKECIQLLELERLRAYDLEGGLSMVFEFEVQLAKAYALLGGLDSEPKFVRLALTLLKGVPYEDNPESLGLLGMICFESNKFKLSEFYYRKFFEHPNVTPALMQSHSRVLDQLQTHEWFNQLAPAHFFKLQ